MPIGSNIQGILNTLYTARQIRNITQPNFTAETERRQGLLKKDVGEHWAVQWYSQYRVVLYQRAEQLRNKLSTTYSAQLDTVMMRRIEDSSALSGGQDPLYNTSPLTSSNDPASTSNRTAFLAIDSNKRGPDGVTQAQWWEAESSAANPVAIPGFPAMPGAGDMPLFQDVAYGGLPAILDLAPTAIANAAVSAGFMAAGSVPATLWEPADIWLPLFYDPPNPPLITNAATTTALAVAQQALTYGGIMAAWGPAFIMPGELVGGTLISTAHSSLGYGAANSLIRAAFGGGVSFFNNHDIDYYRHLNNSSFLPPITTSYTIAPVIHPSPPLPPNPRIGINVLTHWMNLYNGWMAVEEKSQNINSFYAQHILHSDYTRDTNMDTLLESNISGNDAVHFRNLNIDGRQWEPKDSIWDDSWQDDGNRSGDLYDINWGKQVHGLELKDPRVQPQHVIQRSHGTSIPGFGSRGVDELQPPTGGSFLGGAGSLAIDGATTAWLNSSGDSDANRGPVVDGSGPAPFGPYALFQGSNLFPLPTQTSLGLGTMMDGIIRGQSALATLAGGKSFPGGVSMLSTRTPQVGSARALGGGAGVTGWESWKDENAMPTTSLLGNLQGLVVESFAHSMYLSDLFHYTGGWDNWISDRGCDGFVPIFPDQDTCPFDRDHWDTQNWRDAPLKTKLLEADVVLGTSTASGSLQQDASELQWLLNSAPEFLKRMGFYGLDLGLAGAGTAAVAGIATGLGAAVNAMAPSNLPGDSLGSLLANLGTNALIAAINAGVGGLAGNLGGLGAIAANQPIGKQVRPEKWISFIRIGEEEATGQNTSATATFQGDFRGVWDVGNRTTFGLPTAFSPRLPIPAFCDPIGWTDNPSAEAEYDAHIREFVAPFLGIMRSPTFLPTMVNNLVNKRYYHYAHSLTNGPAMRTAGYREGYQDTFDLGFEDGGASMNGLFGSFMQFLMPVAMLNLSAAFVSGRPLGPAVTNIIDYITDGLITFTSLKSAQLGHAQGRKNARGSDVLAQSQGRFDRPTGGYWSTMNFLTDFDMDNVAQEYWTWTEHQQDGGNKDMSWRLYNDVIRPHMLKAVDQYNEYLLPNYAVDNQYQAIIESLWNPGSWFDSIVPNPGRAHWLSMMPATTWRANKYMTQYWMDSAFHDLSSPVAQYQYGTQSRGPSGGAAWQSGTGLTGLLPGNLGAYFDRLRGQSPSIEGLVRNPGVDQEGPDRQSRSIGLGVSSSRYTQFSARQTWNVSHQATGQLSYGPAVSDIAHVQNKWLQDGGINIDGNQSLSFDEGAEGGVDLDLTFNRDDLYKVRFTGSMLQPDSGLKKTIAINRATDPVFGGGYRLAEVRDSTSAGFAPMKHSINNRVVNLVKQYLGDPDDPTTWLAQTDPTLAREYRDVFHMGFFDHINIVGQASDVAGGGIISSMDVNYINRVISNKLLDSMTYDLNDYYAAGGGEF